MTPIARELDQLLDHWFDKSTPVHPGEIHGIFWKHHLDLAIVWLKVEVSVALAVELESKLLGTMQEYYSLARVPDGKLEPAKPFPVAMFDSHGELPWKFNEASQFTKRLSLVLKLHFLKKQG